jgi:hypothetical protein
MMKAAIRVFQAAKSAAGGSGGSGVGAIGGDEAANAALARRMFPGWSVGSAWAAWNDLEMREAGWNRFARNPGSGAYGIPQALPASKLPFAGQAAGGSHAGPQIEWMHDYILGRYGSVEAADAHERAVHWYGSGLSGGVFTSPTLIGVGDRPERVDVTPLGHGGAGVVIQNLTITLPPGSDREQGRRIVGYIRQFEKGSGANWRR